MFSVKAILKIKESKGLKGQKNRYLASKLKESLSVILIFRVKNHFKEQKKIYCGLVNMKKKR